MPKKIDIYHNASFSELDWDLWEIIGINSRDTEYSQSFILFLPDKIKEKYVKKGKINLIYTSKNNKEEWWVYAPEIICLGSPNKNLKKKILIPNYSIKKKCIYSIETALAGREAIYNYLKNNKQGLQPYAQLFKKNTKYPYLKLRKKLTKPIKIKNNGLLSLCKNLPGKGSLSVIKP